MAFTHALSTNNYGNAKLIVATSAANGTHTSLATAMADAVSGDTIFMRDSVTENVTITPGVNIAAWSGVALNVPTIIGTLTMTGAGTSTVSGLRLQTNSANLLAVTGSAASIVNLRNCYLNCTNNTGISMTTSSSSAKINIFYCSGDLGTTGIGLYSSSSAGQVNLEWTQISNSGSSTTASSNSAGLAQLTNCNLNIPLSTTSTGAINLFVANYIDTSLINTTALLANGTGNGSAWCLQAVSGSASAISIGTGVTFNLFYPFVSSSNTNAITGAGAVVYQGATFSGSKVVNTTTQTGSGVLIGSQNTAPSAGFIGQKIETVVLSSAPISLSNTTAKSIANVSLTAGIWDVTAIGTLAGTLTGTLYAVGISPTDNTLQAGDSGNSYIVTPTVSTVAANSSLCVANYRVTLASTTTYYLIQRADFSVGTATCWGRISATRVG